MISGQPRPIRTETEDQDPPLRLEMKPPDAPRGHVDGGWWPRSNDPAAEFPALIAALSSRVGSVNRVSYHLDSWGMAARKVPIAGRDVRFEGFHSMDPHTVVVIGTDSRRVNLLVVPSDVVGGVARAVLRAASGHDSTASVADILAGNGVTSAGRLDTPPVVPYPRSTEPAADERREADGGHARR